MPYHETSLKPSVTFKRLQFLSDLLRMRNIGVDEVCALLGIQRVAYYGMFASDDVQLSRLERIVGLAGYRMEIILHREGEEPAALPVLDASCLSVGSQYTFKRMTFLSAAMKRYGMGRGELADTIGLARSTVLTWFKVDDIKFARVFQCADAMGLSVDIRLVQAAKDAPLPDGARRFTVTMDRETVVPLD